MFNKTLAASYDELIRTYNKVGKVCKNWNEIKDQFCQKLAEIQKEYYEQSKKGFATFEEEMQILLSLHSEGEDFSNLLNLIQAKYETTRQIITKVAISKIKIAERSFKKAVMTNSLQQGCNTNTNNEDNMYL